MARLRALALPLPPPRHLCRSTSSSATSNPPPGWHRCLSCSERRLRPVAAGPRRCGSGGPGGCRGCGASGGCCKRKTRVHQESLLTVSSLSNHLLLILQLSGVLAAGGVALLGALLLLRRIPRDRWVASLQAMFSLAR